MYNIYYVNRPIFLALKQFFYVSRKNTSQGPKDNENMNSFFAYFKSTLTWQRVPANSFSFKALDREIWFLVVYTIFYTATAYLIGLVILHFPLPILGASKFNQDVWYSIIFKIILLLLIPSIFYFKLWGYKLKDLILGSRMNILSAIIAVALGFFINIGHLNEIQKTFHNFSDAPLRLTLAIIMPLFIAAIPEEFYFRGYLQTRFEKNGIVLLRFCHPAFFSRYGIYQAGIYYLKVLKVRPETGFRSFCIPECRCLLSV